jgi:hypothetical protein
MTTSATADQTWKRVRISDPSELSPVAHSSAIGDFVLHSFASLPTSIIVLASHYTEKPTKLQNKARHGSITIEKMAEDDFIPTPARIKSELGATQKVKETSSFTTLAVTTLVATFQKNAHSHYTYCCSNGIKTHPVRYRPSHLRRPHQHASEILNNRIRLPLPSQ